MSTPERERQLLPWPTLSVVLLVTTGLVLVLMEMAVLVAPWLAAQAPTAQAAAGSYGGSRAMPTRAWREASLRCSRPGSKERPLARCWRSTRRRAHRRWHSKQDLRRPWGAAAAAARREGARPGTQTGAVLLGVLLGMLLEALLVVLLGVAVR